ncbi:hypothetical protein QFC19_008759 [Naganishia cerealis]|uniref:Uncharacterized protein n=1 Tax=Naganishia cerealis TaxID=610337 RepID=A0ACC2V0S9_9TREE|nr:hypothetical protein QFC19_008759 [Naganishia cerealis]
MRFSTIISLSIAGLITATIGQAAPAARNNGHGGKKGDSTTYAECQRPKDVQGTQLQGCPENTVYVSQTDPQSEFGTGMTSDPSNWEKNQVKLWSSSYINQSTQTSGK